MKKIKNILLCIITTLTMLQPAAYMTGADSDVTMTCGGGKVHIAGKADSGKAGELVTLRIFNPGYTASDLTADNMNEAVAYQNQTVTMSMGSYSFDCDVTASGAHSVVINEGGKVINTTVENKMSCEITMDAVGHMYYDYKNIPVNFKVAGCEGDISATFTVTEKSGFRSGEVYTKTEKIITENGAAQKIVILDLTDAKMQYGVFNLDVLASDDRGNNISYSTSFSVSRESLKGEENKKVGVVQHFFSVQKDGDIAEELEIVRKAGFGTQRQSVYWSSFETEKGKYGFGARTQSFYDIMKEKGMDLFLQMFGGNALYYDDNKEAYGNPDSYTAYPPNTSTDLTAFADYAYNLALQSKNNGHYYEIWNEYNLSSFNPQKLPASSYAEMLKAVYDRIHLADPEAVVVGMSLWCNKNEEKGQLGIDWAEDVLKALGNGKYMDAVSLHLYVHPENLQRSKEVEEYKNLFAEYGYEDIKIVISETGYDTGNLGISDLEQARRQIRNLALLENETDRIYIYNAFAKSDVQSGYGIIKSQTDATLPYEARASYVALANYNKLLAGATIVSEDITEPRYVCKFRGRNGNDIYMLWCHTGSENYTLNTGAKAVNMYDMFGNVTELTSQDGKYAISVTTSPKYIEVPAAQQEAIEITYANSAVNVTVNEINTDNGAVVVAKYKDGALIHCELKEMGQSRDYNFAVNVSNGETLSVYVWDMLTLEPIAKKDF